MRLPERLSIRVLGDGQPMAGMFAAVEVKMRVKNDFHFLFGPGDAEGWIQLSREQLLSQAQRDMELFLMDYRQPESYGKGQILIQPANQETVAAALKAYPLFADVYTYPRRHRENLEVAARLLEKCTARTLRVEVTSEGGDMTIATEDCAPRRRA